MVIYIKTWEAISYYNIGGSHMRNFKYVTNQDHENCIKPQIEDIEKLYNCKINEVKSFLFSKYNDYGHWDITSAIEVKSKFMSKIYDEFIKHQDLRCIKNINERFNIILERYKENFEIIDDEATEELEKYEQYFDTLCEMPSSIYFYLNKNLTDLKCANTTLINETPIISDKINSKKADIYKNINLTAETKLILDCCYLAA